MDVERQGFRAGAQRGRSRPRRQSAASTRGDGDGQFACGSYRMETSGMQVINNGGTSTISLTGFTGSFTGVGGLGSSDNRIHAQGVAAPSCTFRG